AVKQSDSDAVEFQIAKQAVARLTGPLDRGSEFFRIVVTVAEYEMRWPRGEKFDHLDRADVAAVQHGVDFKAFEHPHCWARELDVAVRVADYSEPHRFAP